LIRPLFIVWNRLKPFEQFAVCTESVFWTLNRLVFIEVHYMEKNPAMFSSKTLKRKKWHGYLGWHGLSKLSAKVFFLKWTTPLIISPLFADREWSVVPDPTTSLSWQVEVRIWCHNFKSVCALTLMNYIIEDRVNQGWILSFSETIETFSDHHPQPEAHAPPRRRLGIWWEIAFNKTN